MRRARCDLDYHALRPVRFGHLFHLVQLQLTFRGDSFSTAVSALRAPVGRPPDPALRPSRRITIGAARPPVPAVRAVVSADLVLRTVCGLATRKRDVRPVYPDGGLIPLGGMRTLGGSGHTAGPRPSAALSAVSAVVCHQSRMHTPAPGTSSAVVSRPRVRAQAPASAVVSGPRVRAPAPASAVVSVPRVRAPAPASAVVSGPRVRAKRPPASIVRRRFRAHALRPVPSAVISVLSVLSVVLCRSPVRAPASEPGLAGSGATDDVSVAEKTSVSDSFKDFPVVRINRPDGHVAAYFDLVLLYFHVQLRQGGRVGCLWYGPRVFIAIDVSHVNRHVRRFGEHQVGSIKQV